MDELLTVKQVAEHLGVCKMTIFRMIEAGKLPAYKFTPRVWRIERAAMDKLVSDSKSDPRCSPVKSDLDNAGARAR